MTARSTAMEEYGWSRPLQPGAICLEPQELSQAAASLVPGEDPEQAWIRYLRALALLALRRWLKHRGAAVRLGPELEPEAPDRLLAIQGLATQLLCASPLADQVMVPLLPWRDPARAPQLLLLAQVDEENGVVEFPGVLAAAAVAAEIETLAGVDQAGIDLPLEKFTGGLERLLRWVTLLEPEALPRASLRGSAVAPVDGPTGMAALQQWLEQILGSAALVPIPVLGTRGGAPSVVRMLTPEVMSTADGMARALAVCATPSIWADTPLAEIQIEKEGQVVWQQLATRRNPIEGPIPWPLEPLLPQQQLTIRLRPYGTAGGAYAAFTLISPDADAMQKGEQTIQQGLEMIQNAESGDTGQLPQKNQAVATEIRARQWLALKEKVKELPDD